MDTDGKISIVSDDNICQAARLGAKLMGCWRPQEATIKDPCKGVACFTENINLWLSITCRLHFQYVDLLMLSTLHGF